MAEQPSPPEGHNSGEVNGGQLRAIIERVERLDEEIKALNQDKKEIYSEARGNGFDVKIVKKVVAIRRADPDKRAEEEMLTELYLAALGSA